MEYFSFKNTGPDLGKSTLYTLAVWSHFFTNFICMKSGCYLPNLHRIIQYKPSSAQMRSATYPQVDIEKLKEKEYQAVITNVQRWKIDNEIAKQIEVMWKN